MHLLANSSQASGLHYSGPYFQREPTLVPSDSKQVSVRSFKVLTCSQTHFTSHCLAKWGLIVLHMLVVLSNLVERIHQI